jgi:hypothetical protein
LRSGQRSRQIEGQGHGRLGGHGYVAWTAQGDAARTDVLGLAKMQSALDRIAYRAHDRHPPALATISFRPTALWNHAYIVGNLTPLRKFSCADILGRQGQLLRDTPSRGSIAG